MEVIALNGSADCGKSSTLNIAYQLLLNAGYTQVKGHFGKPEAMNFIGEGLYGSKDFFDVLANGNKLVGITSGESSEDELEKRLTSFKNAGCVKAICAYTNTNKYLEIVNKYPSHKLIDKTSQPEESLKRITDGDFARKIVALV
ncbi:MAG TPA: hypothetical protein VK783_01230 [Bacteroidia bacterium]|nr:hypothetical protein [Bacteroidia bacterium]